MDDRASSAAAGEGPGPDKPGYVFRWSWHLLGSDLPKTVKLTGLVESTFASQDGYDVLPKDSTLAKHVGKDEKRVVNDRRDLTEHGWHREVEPGHYRLTIPTGARRPAMRPAVNRRDTPLWRLSSRRMRDAHAELTAEREPGWRNQWLTATLRHYGLSPSERIVATVLALSGDTYGTDIHLGVANIVAATLLSRATVQRALAELRAGDIVEKVLDCRTHGGGLRDGYVLKNGNAAWLEARVGEFRAAKERESKIRAAAASVRDGRRGRGRPEPCLISVRTTSQPCSDHVSFVF